MIENAKETPELSHAQKARLAELKHKEDLEEKADKERKKSHFRSFLQTNKEQYAYEDWLMKESPSAYRVLRFLTQNMDNYNALVCSQAVISQVLSYKRETVARAIKLLKEHKFIDVVRTGGSNVYMVNKMLYWNSWGSNYAYAEFGAKIIVTSTEQDNETKEKIKTQIKRRTEVQVKTPKTNKG